MWAQLLPFLAVSAVVICTPGPDTALTVRNAVVGGRTSGIGTAAGVAAGQVVWTVAASAGIASLVASTQPVLFAIRIVGAMYLTYLGLESLRAAWTGRGMKAGSAGSHIPIVTARRAFRQGVISNLSNPKMAAFFISLLPQFVNGEQARFAVLLALGLLFCGLTFAWLTLYSVGVATAQRWLSRPRPRRAIEALAGCVLVAFGARLAVTR